MGGAWGSREAFKCTCRMQESLVGIAVCIQPGLICGQTHWNASPEVYAAAFEIRRDGMHAECCTAAINNIHSGCHAP